MITPQLQVQDTRGHWLCVPMTNQPMTIGRGPQNALVLSDTSASRQHCVIVRLGSTLHVIDLNSRNGTRINGLKISLSPLRTGDVLEVGHTRITLAARDTTPPTPMPHVGLDDKASTHDPSDTTYSPSGSDSTATGSLPKMKPRSKR